MMSLAVMLPPAYHVDPWGLVDLGQLGPSSRYMGGDKFSFPANLLILLERLQGNEYRKTKQ